MLVLTRGPVGASAFTSVSTRGKPWGPEGLPSWPLTATRLSAAERRLLFQGKPLGTPVGRWHSQRGDVLRYPWLVGSSEDSPADPVLELSGLAPKNRW